MSKSSPHDVTFSKHRLVERLWGNLSYVIYEDAPTVSYMLRRMLVGNDTMVEVHLNEATDTAATEMCTHNCKGCKSLQIIVSYVRREQQFLQVEK